MSNTDKTTNEIDKIKHNIATINNNQTKMLFFLKSNHYIQILANIFQIILTFKTINVNQDFIVLFLSQVEMQITTIDFWINKSLLDLENISKDQDIIYTNIDSNFKNLTQNIKLLNIELLNIELSNIESNQISTLDSYMKAIVKFNIILNNDAIIKEYIISIREILKKCIMYIEKARVMWYNYKFKINTNTIITTTENKKRKSELLDIDIDVDVSVSVSVSVDDQDINKDDNEKKFLFSLASECTSECVSESVANLKTKKTKKSSNNEKVITWLKNNTI